MSVKKLIEDSLRLINVIQPGEEASPDDLRISVESLKDLIDNLGNSQLNTYTTTPRHFLLTPGQQTYTLGPELDEEGRETFADWVTKRPVRIEQVKLLMYPVLPPPPPEPVVFRYVTSTLYPVDVSENMTSALTPRDGFLFDMLLESQLSGLSLVSGTLQEVFFPRYYTQPPEGQLSGISLIGGALVPVGFVIFTQPPEEQLSSIALISGTLVRTYFPLEFTQPPEEQLSGIALISGTLT